ncbi:MAG: T9SS type A sorting domain-containing protein [Saprospiraceae bacterium]|nr:T9SS type A sorting domain-containing protein [Saprospiraceae bacterium]
MKTNLLFLVIFLTCSTTHAQISENFELWVTGPFGFHIPDGWTVNNAEPTRPVSVRNEDPYSGTYALQLFSEGPSFEGRAPGRAFRKFYATTNDPISVYVRVDSLLPGGSAEIVVYLNNSSLTTLGTWSSTTVTSGYVNAQVAIPNFSAPDTLSISLVAKTTLGPLGYDGYAVVTFDALGQITTSTGEPGANDDFSLSPNPTTGLFTFGNGQTTVDQAVVTDLQGRTLHTFSNVREINLINEPPGMYLVHLQHQGQYHTKKIVVGF